MGCYLHCISATPTEVLCYRHSQRSEATTCHLTFQCSIVIGLCCIQGTSCTSIVHMLALVALCMIHCCLAIDSLCSQTIVFPCCFAISTHTKWLALLVCNCTSTCCSCCTTHASLSLACCIGSMIYTYYMACTAHMQLHDLMLWAAIASEHNLNMR